MAMRLECPICLNSLFEPCASGEEQLGQGGEVDLDRPSTSGSGQSSQVSDVSAEVLDLGSAASLRRGRPRRVTKASAKQPAVKAKPTPKTRSEIFKETSVTPCGHLFHSMCLQNWCKEVAGLATCPNCRKKFARNKITQVFMDFGVPEASKPSTAASSSSSYQKLAQFNGRGPSVIVYPVDDSSDDDDAASPTPSTSGGRRERDRERDIADINPASYAGSSLQDLKCIHETLITDFTGLKTKYYDLKDENDLRGALIMSLEHTQGQLEEKLRKYEGDESPAPTPTPRPSPAQTKRRVAGSGPAAKRRKH